MAVSAFALCTLSQVKQALGLSAASASRDAYLERQIERTSRQIESYCRRRFVARDYKEYYDGDGSDTLMVGNYPVLSVATLGDDPDREYTSSTDFVGLDNILTSRAHEGIIRVWDEVARLAKGRGNVYIEYHAGYALLDVEWGQNKLDFRERSTGTTYTVQVAPDEYDVVSLASRVQCSMSSLGLNSYAVSYDTRNRRYKIALSTGPTSTLQILASTGGNSSESVLPTMGFSTVADMTGATSYTCATSVSPHIPRDLEDACIEIVAERYHQSDYGDGRRGVKQERIGDYSVSFFGTPIPDHIESTLKQYKKRFLG